MKAIGLDVGGSTIRGVRWDGRRVEKLAVAKTPRGNAELTRTLLRMIASLESGKPLPIGIGFAGVIEASKVKMSPNNRFLRNYDPSHALKRRVVVDNDARTFARAEYALGAGKGVKRALFFTFGTGVGRAYGIGRVIKRVKRFEHPEQWEKRYQRVKGAAALAPFFAEHLIPIIVSYKPRVVVVGGAVAEKKGFTAMFRRELKKKGFEGEVRDAKLGTLAGAIGAAMIAK